MRKIRENIIVAKNNYPLYPAEQNVFDTASGRPLVLPGQLVIYDPKTLKSLGPGITTTTNDRIVIGVGYDRDGSGLSTTIRKVFGDQLWGWEIQAATAEPSRCGVPQITDLLFDCVIPGQTYSFNVQVEDDRTQNEYPYNRPATYTFSYVAPSEGFCEDCDFSVDPATVACGLIDSVRGAAGSTSALKQSVFVKRTLRRDNTLDLPFHAVRLFPTSLTYCLNPISDSCTNCMWVDAITGFTYTDENSDAQEITLVNSVDPTDSTRTIQGQLQSIVNQINAVLGKNGHAVITKGFGECCTISLEVNTCFTDFTLLGAESAEITACSSVNPFDPITVASACTNCTPANTTKTYSAGIRIIAKPVDAECNCQFPPNTPKGYLGRVMRIEPIGGFGKGSFYVADVQKATLPENTGYEWQNREYASDNGGSGRSHNPFNDSVGRIGLPLAGDRANSVAAKCSESYCSYALEHAIPNTDTGVHGRHTAARGRSIILIPGGNDVTRAEFEAIINPYLASSSCPIKASITCSADQDQDAAYAAGLLTFTGAPVADETITIGSKVYTWKVAPAAANEVKTEAGAAAAILNLIAAVNGGAGAGTAYGTGTVAHTLVTASAGTGTTVVITAKTAGTAGNAIVTTETMTNASFGAATLTGGLAYGGGSSPYPDYNGYIY
jgi:hypothetical protein